MKTSTKRSHKHRLWSDSEKQFLIKEYEKMPYKQIAGILNRSPNSVRKKLQSLGLSLPAQLFVKRLQDAVAGLNDERKNKSKKLKFTGYNIYTITYFGVIDKAFMQRNFEGRKKMRVLRLSFDDLTKDICNVFGFEPHELRKKTAPMTKGEIPMCRQLFCFVAKKMWPKKSLWEIGRYLNYRDHGMPHRNIKLFTDSLAVRDPIYLKYYYKYIRSSKIYINDNINLDIAKVFNDNICSFDLAKKAAAAGMTCANTFWAYDEKGELHDGAWIQSISEHYKMYPAINICIAIAMAEETGVFIDEKFTLYKLAAGGCYFEKRSERKLVDLKAKKLVDLFIKIWLFYK